MIITIPGTPIPQQRPRLSGKVVYDSQAEKKKGLRWVVRSQWKEPPIEDPVHLDFEFEFPVSKSWSKKRKKESIGMHHVATPDLDNLIKWCCDIFNEIVFIDDRLVFSITAKKVYSETPCSKIQVSPLSSVSLMVLGDRE
jgi:Holliday junction resolvase RusA-like endonuclease